MQFTVANAPHFHNRRSVRWVMGMVLLALLPATIVYCLYFGYGVLVQFALALITGVACEALALQLRGAPLRPALTDLSTAVTAALLALSMPPLAPWWLIVSATAFAILLAKHLYGGLGLNPFNPAMVGYAVLLISFPAQMTQWLPAAGAASIDLDFPHTLTAILTGHLPASLSVDVLSAASPLAALKTGLSLRHTMDEIFAQPVFGQFGGSGWEWVAVCELAGGVVLLMLRVIRWHIPLSMLASMFIVATLMNQFDPGHYAGPMFHLFSGATMLGAFFIATDPVTAAASERGRLIYGAGIGVLTYVIRNFGSYHDGVAFAVLLMNLLAPLIDKFTVPRIYGEAR